MKNLLIILIVVFGSIYFVACGDSVDSQEQHQDYVADQNLDTPEDAPDDSISLDVTVSTLGLIRINLPFFLRCSKLSLIICL